MNKDHFWNIGTDEDGRHRAINMENYADTAVGAPIAAPIAAGMDGVIYLQTTSGRVQGFYRNVNGIYQFIPAFIVGTAAINSSYTNIVSLPDNTYGNIIMFKADSGENVAFGSFKAVGGVCQAYAAAIFPGNSSTAVVNLRFGNGDQASGLNFRARTSNASAGSYQYRITYSAL